MGTDVHGSVPAEGHVEELAAELPLTEKLAIEGEALDPAILAVGHIEIAVRTHRDRVHQVEFSRSGSRAAPLGDFPAVGVVFDDPRVAVSVGDEDPPASERD